MGSQKNPLANIPRYLRDVRTRLARPLPPQSLIRLELSNPPVKKSSAAKGWVKEVSQQSSAESPSPPSPKKTTPSSKRSSGGKPSSSARAQPQSASRRALAVLDAAQTAAARQIIQAADVVVCSCIGAGNDAFVRAIGGDQEG